MTSPAARRSPLRKAGKDDMVAVYDMHGRLIGICDPDKITPIADAAGSKTAPEPPPPAAAAPDADVAKQRRMASVRKGLSGGGTAAEQNQLFEDLNGAAITALRLIRRPGRR